MDSRAATMADDVHTGAPLRDVLIETANALPGSDAALARELVAAVLDVTVPSLMHALNSERRVDDVTRGRVEDAVTRLNRGMPFAYAVQSAAFRHLVLHVDERVLIPRPETELLVDHALRLAAGSAGGTVADIGTGSGAIALSLAQEASFERVIATDVSRDALEVAAMNAKRVAGQLRAPVEFRLGADLTPLAGERVRMLVSNPPYIACDEAPALPALVRDWEPSLALFAADGGQARYAELLRSAPAVLEVGGWLVFECDSRRAHDTAAIARAARVYDHIEVHDDLAGRPRVLLARYVS
jgi:release factor glutamine methyltransferase